MHITVVGTGGMTRAIATRLLAGSHSITLHGKVFIDTTNPIDRTIFEPPVPDATVCAIDAGPPRRARQLEALGSLNMAIQSEPGTGYASTIKVLS